MEAMVILAPPPTGFKHGFIPEENAMPTAQRAQRVPTQFWTHAPRSVPSCPSNDNATIWSSKTICQRSQLIVPEVESHPSKGTFGRDACKWERTLSHLNKALVDCELITSETGKNGKISQRLHQVLAEFPAPVADGSDIECELATPSVHSQKTESEPEPDPGSGFPSLRKKQNLIPGTRQPDLELEFESFVKNAAILQPWLTNHHPQLSWQDESQVGISEDQTSPVPVSIAECLNKETLRTNLHELTKIDPSLILMVRRIYALGMDSRAWLKAYFSEFGVVDKVLVAHIQCKSSQKKSRMRVRPARLGFIVMQTAADAQKILQAGPEHFINGVSIPVLAYEVENRAYED